MDAEVARWLGLLDRVARGDGVAMASITGCLSGRYGFVRMNEVLPTPGVAGASPRGAVRILSDVLWRLGELPRGVGVAALIPGNDQPAPPGGLRGGSWHD
jgi:hypothetical protein